MGPFQMGKQFRDAVTTIFENFTSVIKSQGAGNSKEEHSPGIFKVGR